MNNNGERQGKKTVNRIKDQSGTSLKQKKGNEAIPPSDRQNDQWVFCMKRTTRERIVFTSIKRRKRGLLQVRLRKG